MTGPSKTQSRFKSNHRFQPKPKPSSPQEAVPTLSFGPSNNWIDFSKKMVIAAGDRFGRLGDFIKSGAYYTPPLPTPDMTILDSTMRDEVLKADFRERAKTINKLNTEKPQLYAFIMSKLSVESEDEIKRHQSYSTFDDDKDPLGLWKALEQLHLVTTVSKNAAVVLQQAENDYMACHQGEFETITTFKERFDNKLKAYNNALGPSNTIPEPRAAMAFLSKLHKSQYGQFYAHEINIINADATKVPNNVVEVYQKAKAHVIIANTTKQNGTPVSFATTADTFLKSNKKKTPSNQGPRGQQTNNPNNGLLCSKGGVQATPTTTPQAQNTVDPHDQATVPASNTTTNRNQPRDLSRVQCYHCLKFGHYIRDCPEKQDGEPLNGMTKSGENYYSPEWYEVGLDNMSQVNVLNSRFLVNIVPGGSGFRALDNKRRPTSEVGTLPLLPTLECQVCDDCAASVLSFSKVKKTGVRITYDEGRDCFIMQTQSGDIEFHMKGDLYVADFRDYITDQAIAGMTTSQREALFDKTTVKRAQEAGAFVRSAGFPSEKTAIDLVRGGNINNVPINVQDVKNYFEIYGTPVAALRGRTVENKKITDKDDYDSGLKEQVTMQEQTSDIIHIATKKYLISLVCPLQVLLVLPIASMSRQALGQAMQQHVDLVRMFGFNVRIIFVDPLRALAGLRGTIPGVEIQPTGAGDHLPKLDIRIRRLKEMCRAVLNAIDYKLPLSLVNQLVTFCVSRINVQTTSSLTSNWCPRVRLTGRKVDFKKEYSLTFGDYVEARNPQVVSNTMTPRTDPCIALYPTLNVNGSWKLYNLRTKMVVSRSTYVKMKHTPENIINIMNTMGAQKGIINPSDIVMNEVAVAEEVPPEPRVEIHVPDPNIIELMEDNRNPGNNEPPIEEVEEEEAVEAPTIAQVEEESDEDETEEITVESPPGPEEYIEAAINQSTRRSARANAGQSSRYEGYSMLTKGYGLACTNLRVKVALEKFGKVAYEAIKDELIQLFLKKRALVPMKLRDIARENLYYPAKFLRSHMFLREKHDAMGIFEKMKARLVADGSAQDKTEFEDEEISSPTASLESIFNMLKLVAVEKRHLLVLDVGGAYLNAIIDRNEFMYVQPELVKILLDINPGYAKFIDDKGRMLVQIEKAMYGLVQSAKLWFDTITGVLKKAGFVPNPMDVCVWNKNVNGNQVTIVIYVDDLAISCKDVKEVHNARDLIQKEFVDVKIKESKEMTYLGMNIKITNDGVEVSMTNYIKEILKEYDGLYEYAHPADEDLFSSGDAAASDNAKGFHSVVARLLYLCKRGRPDVALPVHYLCTKVKDPNVKDELRLKRVLGYLQSSLATVRKISGQPFNRVEAYIDAAFACHADGKGQSGAVIMVGGTAVETITRKQKCVARDSTEAELVALEALLLDVEWHHEWFKGQGYDLERPLVHQDNTSTITLVTQGGGKMRNKTMRVKQAVILEGYINKEYDIDYVQTDYMIADMFTKPLSGMKYHRFKRIVLGYDQESKAAGVRRNSAKNG